MRRNTTLDHAEWLHAQDLDTEDDRDALLDAVERVDDHGPFSCSKDTHGRRFVTGISDDQLLLPTRKSTTAFLRRIRAVPVADDLEEGFRRGVDNPHS